MIPNAFYSVANLIQETAHRYGWDPSLLAAQIHQESAFRPNATSGAGAQGIAQFMPATWKEYGKGASPFDPKAAIDASVRLMRDLYAKFGDIRLALAAYNCGPGNVAKAMAKAGSPVWEKLESFLPGETRAYVPAILQKQALYQGTPDTPPPPEIRPPKKTAGQIALDVAPFIVLGLLALILLRRVL